MSDRRCGSNFWNEKLGVRRSSMSINGYAAGIFDNSLKVTYDVITGFVNRSWQMGQTRFEEGSTSKSTSSAEFGTASTSRAFSPSAVNVELEGVSISEGGWRKSRTNRQ